jgi:hypothetical protein
MAKIMGYCHHYSLTVTANELDPTATRVYTLTIADSHTYAVGELGAWVHNYGRGRGIAIRAILNSEKTASWIKGWIKQERNRKRPPSKVRSPPGHDLCHPLGKPQNQGNDHGPNDTFGPLGPNRSLWAREHL